MSVFQYLSGDFHQQVVFNFINNPNKETLRLLETSKDFAVRTLGRRAPATGSDEIKMRDSESVFYKEVYGEAVSYLSSGDPFAIVNLFVLRYSYSSMLPFMDSIPNGIRANLVKSVENLDTGKGKNIGMICFYYEFYPEVLDSFADSFSCQDYSFLFENRSQFKGYYSSVANILMRPGVSAVNRDKICKVFYGRVTKSSSSAVVVSCLESGVLAFGTDRGCLSDDFIRGNVVGLSYSDIPKKSKVESLLKGVFFEFESYLKLSLFQRLFNRESEIFR